MKALLTILLLSVSGFAQVEKHTGEVMMLTIKNVDPADSFSVYRQSVLIGAIAAVPNVWTYNWATTMPAGKTRQYSYWVEVKKSGLMTGKSNVVIVKRIR